MISNKIIYDNNICFRHSDENIAVTFSLESKEADKMHFVVLTQYGLFETKSTTKFITADIQEMRQAFLRIYNNAPMSYRNVFISSDTLTEIVVANGDYGHVIISFIIRNDRLNVVQADIKTDLASLPYLINEIEQCLNANGGEYVKKDEREGCCLTDSNLRVSVEKYSSENDIYQNFFDVNIFFSSDFVTFSLFITLYDFEYSTLMGHVNENGDFLYYIRPLDHGDVDLSFHAHNHLITFQGNIDDNVKGYSVSFSSNISQHLYDIFVSRLKMPVNRCKSGIVY